MEWVDRVKTGGARVNGWVRVILEGGGSSTYLHASFGDQLRYMVLGERGNISG